MPRSLLLAAALLLAATACSRPQPESSVATANADALADQLEDKANNYAMLADDATNGEAAIAMENASASLDQAAANLRAEASPGEAVKK